MRYEAQVERLFSHLISGDRRQARAVIDSARLSTPAPKIASELLWPVLDQLQDLYRQDMVSELAHHLATRLLRTLVDQNQAHLTQLPRLSRQAIVICGPEESEEMGAQLATDLLEARGYHVLFPGGGVPNDELINQIREARTNLLMIFGVFPSTLPFTRTLIDSLHDEGLAPGIQIAVGGGVFNRAEGLAEEMGADLFANDPAALIELATSNPDHRTHLAQRTVGRRLRHRDVA